MYRTLGGLKIDPGIQQRVEDLIQPDETPHDLVTIDRARFERLLSVAMAAYAETMPSILREIRKLQPSDFDPLP